MHLRGAADACTREGLDEKIAELLNIWSRAPELSRLAAHRRHGSRTRSTRSTIGVVGKYVDLVDRYKTLNEALVHGGIANDCRVELALHRLRGDRAARAPTLLDGRRRHPGARPASASAAPRERSRAIRYARENERAVLRHLPRHADRGHRVRAQRLRPRRAPTRPSSTPRPPHPVIDLMPDQRGVEEKGGTMRLGAYPCVLKPGTLAAAAYGAGRDQRAPPPPLRGEQRVPRRAGRARPGALGACRPTSSSSRWSSCQDHPYFVGCQFHPEFKSRPHGAAPAVPAASSRAALRRAGCANGARPRPTPPARVRTPHPLQSGLSRARRPATARPTR